MRTTLLFLALVGCQSEPDCTDSNCLDTDGIERADADLDGFTDAEEADCGSDPADEASTCFACGWKNGDSGDLATTGKDEGDVIANLATKDQCREDVDLYAFAGSYQILFMTATWCGSCITEARELEDRTATFTQATGLPFHYTVVLFEDNVSAPPKARHAADYAETIGATTMPVLSSIDQKILSRTPYDGRALPGKCILTPTMEMLSCTTGHGDDAELFAMIEEHAGI